ncbi:MAG: hypothetical protein AAFO91_02655, partial [Bacteroidota bacterium]
KKKGNEEEKGEKTQNKEKISQTQINQQQAENQTRDPQEQPKSSRLQTKISISNSCSAKSQTT